LLVDTILSISNGVVHHSARCEYNFQKRIIKKLKIGKKLIKIKENDGNKTSRSLEKLQDMLRKVYTK
jgi:hypothetical protein